jgi:hypothetical protein
MLATVLKITGNSLLCGQQCLVLKITGNSLFVSHSEEKEKKKKRKERKKVRNIYIFSNKLWSYFKWEC